MGAKHTPGPWEIDRQGYIVAPQPETAGPGEELPPEYEVASVGDGSGRLTEREQADLRLIAAAPDLYAAIKEFFECKDWPKATEMMKAAIAKAEGRTS